MFGGQRKKKEKHIFTSFHFPPNKFYLNCHLKNKDINKQNVKHVYFEQQINSLNFTLAQASGHLIFF